MLRIIWRFILKCKSSLHYLIILPFNKCYYKAESYFPELSDRRKSTIQVYFEQVLYILEYGFPNAFYFLYGFDIRNLQNKNDFVDDKHTFIPTRDALNKNPRSQYQVLRNKLVFGIVAEGLGINTPHNIAMLDNGVIYDLSLEKRIVAIDNLTDFYPSLDAFCKLVDGECANGVFRLSVSGGDVYVDGEKSDIMTLKGRVNKMRWIIQQRIEQHDAINAIFPKAINTIRLVTVYNKKTDSVEVLSSLLRTGTGNNHVDNWAVGGLVIGINDSRCTLKEFGYYKPGYGTKTNSHPDTNVIFDGYKVPYFHEAVNEAKRFHSFIKGVHSIGWDIAITPTGPCFIEGNDNWEISMMQVADRGLRKEFIELFY